MCDNSENKPSKLQGISETKILHFSQFYVSIVGKIEKISRRWFDLEFPICYFVMKFVSPQL